MTMRRLGCSLLCLESSGSLQARVSAGVSQSEVWLTCGSRIRTARMSIKQLVKSPASRCTAARCNSASTSLVFSVIEASRSANAAAKSLRFSCSFARRRSTRACCAAGEHAYPINGAQKLTHTPAYGCLSGVPRRVPPQMSQFRYPHPQLHRQPQWTPAFRAK